MNWISLVGLLVVSSSALGRSMYDSYSSRSLHKPKLNMDTPLPTYAYGAVDRGVQSMPTSYGSPYGAAQRLPLFDEPKQKVEAPTLPLTEADILCKGRQAETVIPIDEGFKFIVCLDESKGVEQFCPTGLFYKSETRRCERKFGLSTDPCVSQPCLNNGQCVRTEYSYQCQCAPGFDGRTCELDSRICQTQQPCGQSFDSKCQSFHVGAALQHVCILQDGLFYGLDTRQTYASPCTGDNGPHPLAFSNKGFIMCDGDFLFVQSCPGGTIWDDFNKACVWPEMENIVTIKPNENFLKQNYGQSKYDTSIETPRLPSFGLEIEKPRVSSNWNKIETSRVPSLGLKIETPRVLSYDTKIETPRLESYGAQIETPRVSSNWNKIETSRVPSLGLKIETPRVLSRWNDVQHLPMKPVPIETPRVESNWNQIETPGVTSNWNQIERPAVPSFGVNLVKPQESSYWNEVQHLPMKPALSETPRVESNWNQIERPGVPSFGVNLVKPEESSYWNQVEQLPTKPTFSEKPNEVIRMNSMLVGKQQDFIPIRQSSGY